MKNISIVASIIINGNIKQVFEYVVPIELSVIFKKTGFIPGVKSTTNKEKWYVPGMTRTVIFDDNTSASERLTSVTEFESFTYVINQFTSSLKYMLLQIDGRWDFKNRDSKTEIVWEYSLTPRNMFSSFIIHLILKRSLGQVLEKALNIIKENIENNRANKK
jgi:hypothetical protein